MGWVRGGVECPRPWGGRKRAPAPTDVVVHSTGKPDSPPRYRARQPATGAKNRRDRAGWPPFRAPSKARSVHTSVNAARMSACATTDGWHSFSWDFAGRRPIQTGREAYRTWQRVRRGVSVPRANLKPVTSVNLRLLNRNQAVDS